MRTPERGYEIFSAVLLHCLRCGASLGGIEVERGDLWLCPECSSASPQRRVPVDPASPVSPEPRSLGARPPWWHGSAHHRIDAGKGRRGL